MTLPRLQRPQAQGEQGPKQLAAIVSSCCTRGRARRRRVRRRTCASIPPKQISSVSDGQMPLDRAVLPGPSTCRTVPGDPQNPNNKTPPTGPQAE
eukprot:9571122-Alexandrium_andersonii.AAC.1